MLATIVDEPARVTAAQMDRWCRDFDNWAICDTACFNLFDRTPHAWNKVARGRAGTTSSQARRVRPAVEPHRARQGGGRAPFLAGLQLIEREAGDERNFVKKAINMALRAVGKRNRALNAAAMAIASASPELRKATPRWIGRDALRELDSASVAQRLAKKK